MGDDRNGVRHPNSHRLSVNARNPTAIVTILFTDVVSSTRLWEHDPEQMSRALVDHDAFARAAVKSHHGTLVKMTGDGVHAVFTDPVDALNAAMMLERALAETATTRGIVLDVRYGIHLGTVERRHNDYFGTAVNRAARIMGAAHGGQVLLSQAVMDLVRDRLPPDVTLRDLGVARLRDLASPEHLYQVLHPQLRRDFPALRSLEATPNNLPQQVTSFIGRERELVDANALLGKTRLLTLLGVGGIGKTRLSLQLAADVMDDYPDGVWFVELAAISDARMVAQAIATVLGIKEQAGHPVGEAVLKGVGGRRMLLVLDNCEHLIQACAELAGELLQSGPHLKILASSREPLHIAGERTYSMPALAVPNADDVVGAQPVMEFEAVHLFVERAAAAQPAFRVTDRNAGAVARICRHLDGIPLAIELAAARLRALSVETIAERLSDRFHLLTGGYKTSLPRQQTLRALIAWSYDLLTDHERALLRRLAVFVGGWTIDAAETVGAGDGIGKADVLDLMTRLVEKSLVVMEAEHGRYRLLETIREYALQSLEAVVETAATRTRHRDYFLSSVERTFPELFGDQQVSALAHLDRELDNILAAHAWCGSLPDSGQLDLRLVHAIKPYYYNRGLLGLALRITSEALDHPGSAERNLLRCRGLFDAGQLCSFMGRYTVAQTYLEQSLEIAREIPDRQRIASALQTLGMTALGRGDLPAALGYLDEALSMAREIGNQREIAVALNALAQFHRVAGDVDAAAPLYRQILEITKAIGDQETLAIALLNLAMVAVARGDAAEARELLVETLRILADIGSRPIGQSVIEVSAGLAALQKTWSRSARYFGIAEAHAQKTGIHRDPADEAFLSPRITAAREALGDDSFASAEASGRALSYENGIVEIRTWLEGSAL